jgi:hypothetical protein
VTKPPPKSGDVIPIKPQLPATIIASNPFRAFAEFTEIADRVLRRYHQIEEILGTVRDAVERGRADDLAFAEAKARATLSEYDEQHLARCREALQTFDAAENYVDGDNAADLRPSVIALRIAAMLDSNPYAKPKNPEGYITMMVERVIGLEGLTLPALQAACNEIGDESEFLPSLAKVLKALHKHQALWDDRFSAIWNLADESRRIVERLDGMRIEMLEAARTRAAKAKQAAKVRAVELARQKLEQARRALTDAEDAYCEANAVLREAEDAVAEAKRRVLECENDLSTVTRMLEDQDDAE